MITPERSLLAKRLILGMLPFAILIAVYAFFSAARLEDNPQDKLLPSLSQMVDGISPLIFKPDPRSGNFLFWNDTLNSLRRIFTGVGLAAAFGLVTGLNMGLSRRTKDIFGPFFTILSLIPPLAILPILFIALGVDEVSKIALIFIGVYPIISRDIMISAETVPIEHITKAFTLGASKTGLIYRIVMPQVLPRLINAIRLSLGGAWLFLIAAEAIASTEGLGYRIFLMRRYLAMDVIIPYVAWITLIGFSTDWLLRQLSKKAFPWNTSSD